MCSFRIDWQESILVSSQYTFYSLSLWFFAVAIWKTIVHLHNFKSFCCRSSIMAGLFLDFWSIKCSLKKEDFYWHFFCRLQKMLRWTRLFYFSWIQFPYSNLSLSSKHFHRGQNYKAKVIFQKLTNTWDLLNFLSHFF